MPRVSKIAKLPPQLRAWLQTALVDRGYGDITALAGELNKLLKQSGVDETVGKSAVGQEAQRLKRLHENIRATTEAATSIAAAARDDGDVRSEAIMAVIQSDIWNSLVAMQEAGQIKNPEDRMKAMARAAKAVGEMSRARVNQSKWATAVRGKSEEMAEKAAKALRKSGASAATIDEIRRGILGIADKPRASEALA